MLSVCFGLAPAHVGASEIPFSRPATATPPNILTQSATWVDDLAYRLTTDLSKKYPEYDFTPYAQELNRIRGAVNRGDQWSAKRETGVFLKMLSSRAYGLGDDAAEELTDLARQAMPSEEFGIIFPGSELQGDEVRESRNDCRERPTFGGRV